MHNGDGGHRAVQETYRVERSRDHGTGGMNIDAEALALGIKD
jgi:hypothetical protein